MKRKAEKIKNNILLSIKDACLKEESRDADLPVVHDEIKKLLKLLSKHKDIELIKYGIAAEIILDDDFKNADNTSVVFFERISLMIFDDKNVIKKMEADYKRIAARIYGTSTKSYLESAATLISKLPIPKKAAAVAGAVAFGVNFGYTHLQQRKQAKKLSTLSSRDFAKRLIISAINLLYASNHFESEMEYRNYFKYKLKEINLERKFIMKELFEDQYEIEENQLKLEILHNFDDYLIEQMSLYNKKRGK